MIYTVYFDDRTTKDLLFRASHLLLVARMSLGDDLFPVKKKSKSFARKPFSTALGTRKMSNGRKCGIRKSI